MSKANRLAMQDEQRRIIPAGGYWLGVVPSGRILRLTDAHGNQAADTLFFNADDFSERYSAMQTHDTKTMHSCRDSWLLALNTEYADLNLTKADLSHNVNFFMNVPVTSEGGLTFEDGVSGAGKYVDILARINLAVLISNCPQLNNPCNGYNPTPVQVELRLQ